MTRHDGFTLLEVMVAAVLLLLATAAGVSLVAQGRRSYRDAESRERLHDTARAALDVVAHEVRMAGYLGRLPPGAAVAGSRPIGSPEPAELAVGGGCIASLALDLARPVSGADGAYAAAVDQPLSCPPGPAGHPVAGSDTLIVRHASAAGTRRDPGRLQLETTRRAGRLFADGQSRLGPFAAVHDLEVSAFYVSEESTAAPGCPSIRRKRLVGGTTPRFQDEEIQTGVADLQVEAQVTVTDANGNRQVDFRPLGAVPRDLPVRALRIWILAQGESATSAPAWLPPLAYAGRMLPGTFSRYPRLLASRTVELRNARVAP